MRSNYTQREVWCKGGNYGNSNSEFVGQLRLKPCRYVPVNAMRRAFRLNWIKMAEKSSSQTRKPQKIRVCTVCKEHVKDKMYRSLVSEPSEPYRKYITEIGIPATGHLCYPCVSKLNRLVKIDRDLSTLLDKLKQKRVHLMCELKMLSTGMDHVDANFTSNILGMTPKLESPPPKAWQIIHSTISSLLIIHVVVHCICVGDNREPWVFRISVSVTFDIILFQCRKYNGNRSIFFIFNNNLWNLSCTVKYTVY